MTWEYLSGRINDVIVRTDMGGTILYVSPACRNFGYEAQELVGRMAADFVHADDLAKWQANTLALFVDHRPGEWVDREHRFRRKDGSWVWLEGSPTVIAACDGRPAEILNIFRDVTEQRELRIQLQAALADAEQAAKVKSQFLANMSHEIRTPLTAVLGFASLLGDRADLDETATRQVARIGGASRALLAIVNDVLDFSKLEAGQMHIAPRPMQVIETAREVLEMFGLQAEAKSISLNFAAAGDVPDQVALDPDRLRQILLNLVGNAVKFTDRGAVSVTLDYEPGSGRLGIDVTDTGPGIAAQQRRKLFRRFSQIDGSSTRTNGGTGLGLAISHGLAQAMGGAITVRSRVGRGSVFRLELSAPAVLAVAPEEAPIPAPHWRSGLKVLVVDDNAANRELARAILEPVGIEVADACEGQAAIQLALHTAFDLILMDLRMPGLDGRGATAAIRSQSGPKQATPILAFTAEGGSEMLRAGALPGFQGLVSKPLVPSAFLAALSRALEEDAPASEPDAHPAAA